MVPIMNAHKICHCDAQIHTHTHTHTHTNTYFNLEKLLIMSSLFFIFSFVFFLDWQIEYRDRTYVLLFFLSCSLSLHSIPFLPALSFLSSFSFLHLSYHLSHLPHSLPPSFPLIFLLFTPSSLSSFFLPSFLSHFPPYFLPFTPPSLSSSCLPTFLSHLFISFSSPPFHSFLTSFLLPSPLLSIQFFLPSLPPSFLPNVIKGDAICR